MRLYYVYEWYSYCWAHSTAYQGGVLWLEIGSTIIKTAEAFRITIWAVIRNHRGATIILVGMVLSLIGLCLRYLLDFTSLLPYARASIYSISFETFGTLCIPLFISAYLASEFAFSRKSLAAQLIAVEHLSAQTIIQQKEKQQLLTQQNETPEQKVAERTSQLQVSLHELKSTQAQLIQKEKMASLGELTAGIAHEIQNPLTFVNNFSEVSTELIDELKVEIDRGDIQEAKILSGDLRQNLQKITLHGGRASSIVKGMLEHARTTTGERQPTDLNALCDEYLRLAYHGFRAKDKDFNAELKTDFDPSLAQVDVVPQEIGRVLLNLYNNAFFAVQQKQKAAPPDYQPTITVGTTQVNGQAQIRVGDNGIGIPESVKAKIFQPFFTTKPTGEGTGLGLSLSYDIITKGHGGELSVETLDRQGAQFVITLPNP